MVVVDLDNRSQRLHLGLELSDDQVMNAFRGEITTEDIVDWDNRRCVIESKRISFLGSIRLAEQPLAKPDRDAVAAALEDAFTNRGPALFGRLGEADDLRSRVMMIRAHSPGSGGTGSGESETGGWPDFSDEGLEQSLIGWLGGRMIRIEGVDDLNRIDVLSLLRKQLSWDQLRSLDELAPRTWKPASGRAVRLCYGGLDGDPMTVLASLRIRDALGTDVHPTVMHGAVPVVVELLSPAGRPVQRTTDLPGFWRGSYKDLRSELRGRYPRHPWPEEPWNLPGKEC